MASQLLRALRILFVLLVLVLLNPHKCNGMPELPEVEAARRLLQRCCVGKVVRRCIAAPDEKVFEGGISQKFAKHMTGSHVVAACRKGKQLWLELQRPPHPSFHLGMTGSFAALRPNGTVECAEYVNSKVDASQWPPKHWKFHLEMEPEKGAAAGEKVAFVAIRRFERVRLQADPRGEHPVKGLGFDPLLEMPPAEAFAEALATRQGPVKGALLDQVQPPPPFHARCPPRPIGRQLTPHRHAARVSQRVWATGLQTRCCTRRGCTPRRPAAP